MRRRLPTLAGVLSLLLCAAIASLWLRSYFTSDVLMERRGRGTDGYWALRGRLHYAYYWFPRLREESGWHYLRITTGQASTIGSMNPMFGEGSMPLWLALIPSVLPLAWALLRRRPHPPGCCPGCGFDLRASRDRCPECGKRIESH